MHNILELMWHVNLSSAELSVSHSFAHAYQSNNMNHYTNPRITFIPRFIYLTIVGKRHKEEDIFPSHKAIFIKTEISPLHPGPS